MSSQQKEKRILFLSFWAGLTFATAEFIFAIYSHSQSALMDAAYDASELVFIVLILFLTPLFHKPISEQRPYGFAQVESIFLVIKGFMMLAVTFSLAGNVINALFTGGTQVDGMQVAAFQLVLGLVSIVILAVMKYLNRTIASPTADAELLGWKLDVAYSLGMSGAFFLSTFLDKTPLVFLSPYVDQLVALAVVLFTLPESLKMLWGAIKDVFLFSPDHETVEQIKEICNRVLDSHDFAPVFYDITRTGRRLWVAVYFKIAGDSLPMDSLEGASHEANQALALHFENCTCELIAVPPPRDKA